jgi:hypothetical protein
VAEATTIEVVEGTNGRAEIREVYEANQPLHYEVRFAGQTEVFQTLGEAYIEAGKRAGVKT